MRLRRLTGFQFRTLSGSPNYESIVKGIAPGSLIAYWPLNELSGLTAYDVSGFGRNGVYSGVTLAQIAGPGPSMGLAGLWDGVNDYCNIYSAGLAAAFPANEGTIFLWFKVLNAGVWTDGAQHYLFRIFDTSGGVSYGLNKATTNNTLNPVVKGSTPTNVTYSDTGWSSFGITYSAAANQTITYLNGVAQGTVVKASSTISITDNTRQVIGAATTLSAAVWSGYLAHIAVLSAALTPAQITTLATAR